VLNSLIEEALANNKNVKIAAAHIDNAVGILIQVRAPLFPQIGYDGSYTRMRNSTSLASAALPFEIDIPIPKRRGRLFSPVHGKSISGEGSERQVESARANVFSTFQARQQVILSLVASVANSYLQLRSSTSSS